MFHSGFGDQDLQRAGTEQMIRRRLRSMSRGVIDMKRSREARRRAHLICGGYPAGASAGHDMAYARLRLLELLYGDPGFSTTVANDFTDLDRWLERADLLVTYVAGPYPDDSQNRRLAQWLEEGGRWLALHGTSGGKAAPIDGDRRRRAMVKTPHHATLGGFFLNHPPVRRFRVDVADSTHPLVRGLPPSFEVEDELYLVELQNPASTEILLTTELAEDPSPPGFGFVYEKDTALEADGRSRVLGFSKKVGAGEVVYIALGHCHDSRSNVQPFVDESLDTGGVTPRLFRGPWETDAFRRLLSNSRDWALAPAHSEVQP